MALGDLIAKTLPKVFAKVGTEVTFSKISAGSYNVTDGTVGETLTDTEHKGTLSDVSLRETNELIQSGDKTLLVPASEFSSKPSVTDQIVISSVIHQIIQVRVQEFTGVDLVYTIVLRA